MQVERTNANALVVSSLPDGSRVIVDSQNNRVLALNATAGAAWDACSEPTTLSVLTEQMRSSLGTEITEEVAEESILQLQEQNLLNSSTSHPSRRRFIAALGTVALPLVISLTAAEQRGYAEFARSGAPCPEPVRHKKLPIQHSPTRPVKGPFRFFE